MQEGGGSLQGGGFAPAKNVVEYESEQSIVCPLAAFEQQDLARREEDDPTCRMSRAEYAPSDDVVPSFLQEWFRGRYLPVVLHWVGRKRERIFVFSVWIIGTKDKKLRRALLDSDGVEDGHFVTGVVVQEVVGGLETVPESRQDLAKPLALQANAGLVSSLAAELLAELQVRPGQGAQGLVWRMPSILALGGGFAPAGRGGPDVVGEDL